MSMITAWILILIVVATGLLLLAYRETYIVKVTWRYALIIIPFLIVAIVKSITKKPEASGTTPAPAVPQQIYGIKDQLAEAHLVSAIEAAAVREDNKNKLDQLKQATAIVDSGERRRKLAELMG